MNWKDFLTTWRLKELQGYAAAELDRVPLPRPLRRYYEVAGRLPTWNLHLVEPRDLAIDDDGRVRFIVEEQGVCSFSTLPDGGEPPVWLAEDDVVVELGERLSAFLLQYAVHETVGKVGGWGYVQRSRLPNLLALLPPRPLEPWPHPSGSVLTFHAADRSTGLSSTRAVTSSRSTFQAVRWRISRRSC